MGGCEKDLLVNGGLGPGPWGHWHIIIPHVGTEIREELGGIGYQNFCQAQGRGRLLVSFWRGCEKI